MQPSMMILIINVSFVFIRDNYEPEFRGDGASATVNDSLTAAYLFDAGNANIVLPTVVPVTSDAVETGIVPITVQMEMKPVVTDETAVHRTQPNRHWRYSKYCLYCRGT